jgi:hypothetical protein
MLGSPKRTLVMLGIFAVASPPFAGNQSAHTFKSEGSGVFSRILFSAPGPAHTTVTIRDIIVGPRQRQSVPALPGPALLSWFEGHGTFSISGGPPHAIGNEFEVIPAGRTLTVNNPNGPPIGFRLYLFSGK